LIDLVTELQSIDQRDVAAQLESGRWAALPGLSCLIKLREDLGLLSREYAK
jgi:hypothetical protein